MTSQINRRRFQAPQGDDKSPGAERFGVHTFGNFLKQERLRRGISRSLLSARAQIEPARLSSFECNAVVPHLDEMERMAKAMGLERELLLRKLGLLRP